MISCQQCRDELAEYALGQSDAAYAASVQEHLRACADCRRELAEVEQAWSALPATLAPTKAPPRLFDQVLARIDYPPGVASPRAEILAEAAGDAHPGPHFQPSRRERILSYILAASVLVGLSAGYYRLLHPGDAQTRQSVQNFAERLGNLQQLERLMRSENVRVVSFKQTESPDGVEAYLLWDMAAGQWHFFAKLPPAPAAKTYQLWAAADDGRMLAGPTFETSAGVGGVLFDLPAMTSHPASKAIVTLEPAGGSQQPSGKTVLEAAL